MTEAAKKERNEYQRQWRAKNKEKVKATNARYWEKRVRQKMEKEAGGEQEDN